MRVLLVNVYFWPDSFGGATIVAERTARELTSRGHDVAVVCTTSSGTVQGGEIIRYEAGGMPVLSIGVGPNPPDGGYSNPESVEAFEKIVRTWKPDIIHFHAVQTVGVEVVEWSIAAGFPVVVTLHDAWWLCERQFMVRSTGQWCGQEGISPVVCASCVPDRVAHEKRQRRSISVLNSAARVLAPSEYWRALMVRSGLDAGRIRVNANGVVLPDVEWERPSHAGHLRLGFVGGIGTLKGSRVVVEALNLLERSDYVLRVVDNTQNLGLTSTDVGYWQVPGQVQLVGAYGQDELDGFFASIDVLLFPSQAPESHGLTVREALARGVWPIATSLGGVAEALSPGVNGTLVSLEGGPGELAQAIGWILANPSMVGRHRTEGLTSFTDQAIDLEQHYEAAIAAQEESPHDGS